MNRFVPLLSALAVMVAPSAMAQTQQYQQSFEDGTGYTTSAPEYSDGFGDFFTRTDGSGISPDYSVTNIDGSFYFAAQDLDGDGAAPIQTVSITGIDISGLTGLELRGLFGEDAANDGNSDWDDADYVHISYQIDGGGFQNLIWFENDGAQFNGAALQDTDFDGTGDGQTLTDVLAEFTASIAGTGSTLDINIEIALDSGDEDIAFDNLRIFGTEDTPPPPPGTQMFCSADGGVEFPAASSETGAGPTNPYPTTIDVSGVTGTVTDVNVVMNGVSHSFTGDMDVFVEHPLGPTVWLFSDQGSASVADNANVTFDDEAPGAAPIPFSGPFVTGTYIPANVGTTSDVFDAPAPAVPTSVSLADFDGADPNGTWNLWGDDDGNGDTGEFDNWCVILTVEAGPPPPVNEDPIAVDVTDGDTEDVEIGDTFMATYSFSDPDMGDVVSIATTNAPANFTATPTDGNPATVMVSFAPTEGQANQSYAVTFTATDGNGGSAAATVTYNVGDAPPPPPGGCDYAFRSINLNGTTVAEEGSTIRYKIELDNTTNVNSTSVDIWATVAPVDGDVIYVRTPRTFAVPAGARLRSGYNQRIPGYVPNGTYTYTINAGMFNEGDPSASEICGSEIYSVTKGDAALTGKPAVVVNAEKAAANLKDSWVAGEMVEVQVTSDNALTLASDEVRVGPNPVQGAATFSFALDADADVSLTVYDARGREVAALVNGPLTTGTHSVEMTETLPAGIYVWRLTAGERVQTGRITVVR